jgi:hypothetical protein
LQQAGRRNVNAAWRIELELGNKADLIEIGKAKQAVTLKQNAKTVLSENDNTVIDHEPDAPEWDCPECGATYYGSTTFCRECFKPPAPKHDTRKHIAKAAGVSTGQVGMAEQLAKKAPALWEKAIAGAVEAERRAKQAETQAAIAEAKKAETEPKLLSDPMQQKIVAQPTTENRNVTDTKTAEIFGTNRTDRSRTGMSRCAMAGGWGWDFLSR